MNNLKDQVKNQLQNTFIADNQNQNMKSEAASSKQNSLQSTINEHLNFYFYNDMLYIIL